MIGIALRMLVADRAKFAGLVFGLAFTSFLVTFAAGFLSGFMTNGFSLIAENADVDVWVMDPAVESVEKTTSLPLSALERVRGVDGVAQAYPLWLTNADARFPNGAFQPFQVIAVDDASLAGAPTGALDDPSTLRTPGVAIVDAGGTSGKLQTPRFDRDRWPHDGAHLAVPTRELAAGDELLVNGRLVRMLARSQTLPRFPPRPLLYMTRATALATLPPEQRPLTFVMVKAAPGVNPADLALRIADRTGLRARSRADFKADTVHWYLVNSEDVGDISAMLILAMTMGLGVSGVMLYMFTHESRRHYAVLKAIGAPPAMLARMVIAQAGASVAVGAGIGLGACGVAAIFAVRAGFPLRMLWFTPLVGLAGVLVVGIVAVAISLRPVMKLEPGAVFSGV
ncbi:MAG: ABC transporter permease [Lysobacter sp.]|nr:MAG: ABC transporter permease [Lysobacter sp.]